MNVNMALGYHGGATLVTIVEGTDPGSLCEKAEDGAIAIGMPPSSVGIDWEPTEHPEILRSNEAYTFTVDGKPAGDLHTSMDAALAARADHHRPVNPDVQS